MILRLFFIASLVLTLTSCQQSSPNDSAITHVVFCWLKNPEDPKIYQQFFDASKSFQQIPGVTKVTAGRVLRTARPEVDSSFDLAVVITFKDQKALAEYQKHPIHQKAVQEVLLPNVKKFVVYDFVNEPAFE